jgi:hypothetical protein
VRRTIREATFWMERSRSIRAVTEAASTKRVHYRFVTREICKSCWRPSPVGFSVPDEVWERVKHPNLPGDVLCIMCFARFADELLIEWDREIRFWPVSLVTLHSLKPDQV